MTTAYTKLVNAINGAAAKGKLVDVSELKQDGSGYRVIQAPKKGLASTKKSIPGMPVSSNNYASYALAMGILGPQWLGFPWQEVTVTYAIQLIFLEY